MNFVTGVNINGHKTVYTDHIFLSDKIMKTKIDVPKGPDKIEQSGTKTAAQRNRNYAGLMFSSAISIGTGLGISLGVAFDHIALGISMGGGIGITCGAFLYKYFVSRTCENKKY